MLCFCRFISTGFKDFLEAHDLWVDPLLMMLCRATQSPLSRQVLREAPPTTSTRVPSTTMCGVLSGLSQHQNQWFEIDFLVFLCFFSSLIFVDPGQDGWPTPLFSIHPSFDCISKALLNLLVQIHIALIRCLVDSKRYIIVRCLEPLSRLCIQDICLIVSMCWIIDNFACMVYYC